MRSLTLEAKTENLDRAVAFAESFSEENGCPAKAGMQIALAVEELFVNIARYAYAPPGGGVTIAAEALQDPKGVKFVFTDSGVPYDPLAKEDPDIALPAEERQIGGLGIYLVKKTMDEVSYARENGQNRLTIVKRFR
ncbi:MAG: ATP-binding protein [Clostridia bacterium]|nr:ATP-binding protein [Clostridia bacterium]